MDQMIVNCASGTRTVLPLSMVEQTAFLAQQQATQQQQAALTYGVRYATASTTFGPGDVIVVMATVGQTVTLPSALGLRGVCLRVKNAGVKNTTVAAPIGQTIDGQATHIVGGTWDYVALLSDGANWLTC